MVELKSYSGLIRNHVQLAEQLGVHIQGRTRQERERDLLCAAWQEWGTDMCAHINGQFAFALYDSEADQLFCARDPLGAELFFYYQAADGSLLHGLSIADLFDQPGFERDINTPLIQFFLAFNYVPGEETLFAGVRKLEPGGYLLVDSQGMHLGRYWELTFEPDESKDLDEWADQIEQAMEASLRDIVDEGEEPDSFLSGGVDSSYIMAKSTARTGYCVAYQDQRASEAEQARQTAEYLGRGFEGITVSPEEFFGTLDEFLLAYEQPSADPAGLSLFCACKKVAQRSSLCFSGEGADEFFAGYSVYARTTRLKLNPNRVYYGSTYIMNADEQKRFCKVYTPERSTREFMRRRTQAARSLDLTTWMLYAEMRSYFEGSILFNSTKISRGTGLDIRMPFCDLRMFDVARRMPSRFKVGKEGNKIALRRAASRVLPHEVAYRTKLGFPVPVRSWLADPAYNADIHRAFESEAAARFFNLDEIAGLLDALEGRTPRVGHRVWFKRHSTSVWRYVWVIYVFIRWYELFFGAE